MSLAAGVQCAGDSAGFARDDGQLLGELAAVVGSARLVAPRLSISTGHRPCSFRAPGPDATIPQGVCEVLGLDGKLARQVLALSVRASAAVRREVDPEAVHAAALADLLWADGASVSVDRAISYLQSAARLADRPARVLGDLAAAYLVRAGTRQDPRDLLEAVEAAERALATAPVDPVARFNLALAVDRLGLEGEAAEAWRAYLSVDSTSGWAREARGRVEVLATRAVRSPVPGPSAPESAVVSFASRAPKEARQLGWDVVLPDWGAAVLSGHTAEAQDRLRVAGWLAEGLERRGGDATLGDAVRAIRVSAESRTATRALALGHRAYGLGRAATLAARYEDAGRLLAEAVALADERAPLLAWASLYRGATLVHVGRPDRAIPIFRRLVGLTDTVRYAALAGQSRWALGTALVRRGEYAKALALYHAAAGRFASSGEQEHVGAVEFLAAATEYAMGATAATHASMYRALATLRRYRGSVWLHSLLYAWADAAASAGLPHVAVRLQDEGVSAADAAGVPAFRAEARLARARHLTATGDAVRASQDVTASRAIIDALPQGVSRDWSRADLAFAEATTLMATGPSRATASLDSVVLFFERFGNPTRLLPALVARADLNFTLGRVSAAEADLRRSVALVSGHRELITNAPNRGTLLEAARRTVDRLVMHRVAAGQWTEALDILEQGRASFAPTGPRALAQLSHALGGLSDHVILDYALIDSTLLIWTVAKGAVRLTRSPVDRETLMRIIERARSSLELRASDSANRPGLVSLYDWLIRPVQSHLGVAGTPLHVVADGEIADVPFAALRDSTRGRYLIEDHALTFGTSLHDVVRAAVGRARPAARSGVSFLGVADPAFDPRAFPSLARLTGAAAESEEIAALYRRSKLLRGRNADRATLEASLRQASVVHYAGHAVLEDDRPERSYLVLAASDVPSRDRLPAADIEQLDLQHVRLVVLSACQTSRARNGRSGGFAGLAGAILAAGGGGVVGSLWRVDDELTARLMVEFHRAYEASTDAAGALRTAQLHHLHSTDPKRRSPAMWAAFRYTGA